MSGPLTTISGYESRRRVETLRNTTSQIIILLPALYAINRAWLTIDFISVFIMLLAAVFALVMRALCRAPTPLGFVSSLTRHSTYFEDHDFNHNSTENAPDKSKRLVRLKVMFADVGSGNEKKKVGSMAFAPADMGKKVEEGRWYD
jgi:hypothetical protein